MLPNLIPTMTSNTTPNGIASASSEANEGNMAWHSMDKDITTKWTGEGTPSWLAYEFISSKIIIQYTIIGCIAEQETYTPKDWTFAGWNGSIWITLDTQNNQIGWVTGEKRTFPISNTIPYIKYRINITANNGHATYVTVVEIEMMGASPYKELFIKKVNYNISSKGIKCDMELGEICLPFSHQLVEQVRDLKIEKELMQANIKQIGVGDGGGDMLKSVYDIDEDGIVDNSERLEASTKAQVQDHIPKAHSLGGAQHNADTLANLNAKVSDATLDDSGSSRPAQAHNLGGSKHNADTLANLNTKISDATLDDSGASRTPIAHKTSHENAGGDEINVGGLSGELADAQKSNFLKLSDTPASYAGGGGKAVKVKIAEDGLEFITLGDGGEVPSGLIVMWAGSIAAIPEGWHLCDGTEGTPDLRDKFILSVSAEEEPGGTGGAHSKTLSVANLPAHNHGSKGAHTHFYGGPIYKAGTKGATKDDKETTVYPTSSAGAHTHSNVGSGTAFDNRPAYYKLAYIMKL